jgi:hypothetical protein
MDFGLQKDEPVEEECSLYAGGGELIRDILKIEIWTVILSITAKINLRNDGTDDVKIT